MHIFIYSDPRLKDDGFNLLHRACLRISDDKTAAEVVSLLLLERYIKCSVSFENKDE